MHSRYDVFVAGAGPAGVVAAIQAARAGARTLLVEKSGMPGGATTLNGVNFPGLFHAWGRQIIAGVGWEWVARSVREIGGEMPDFRHDERRHWMRQVRVDRFTHTVVADQMLAESGVDLLLHTMPQTAVLQNEEWHIGLACKEGPRQVIAKVLIDCTGDANLVSLAGFPPRRNDSLQPGTLVFISEGYDAGEVDSEALITAAQLAIEKGEVLATDFGGRADGALHILRTRGENNIPPGIDARTSEGKTDAEIKGRAALLRLQRFYRRQPGLEKFHAVYVAPECGIRETVTIEGEVVVTAKDYTTGRVWEDSVCFSFYPIDVHKTDGSGVDVRPLEHGVFPTIPLRALLPKGSRGLIAAGRIASSDKDAHSALRVQASAMAMGQAAGASAALAAAAHGDIHAVPFGKIVDLLRRHGAIVPGPIAKSPK